MSVEMEGALRPRSTSERKPLVTPVRAASCLSERCRSSRSRRRRELREDMWRHFINIRGGRRDAGGEALTADIPPVNFAALPVNPERAEEASFPWAKQN